MGIREQLNSIAKERILILDGAMGSLIQVLNLDEDSYRGDAFRNHPTPLLGCNDLLCLTRPGAIAAIHDTYLEAGADIIETCSFNSTSISLSDYGLGNFSYDISVAAAKIARSSADKFSVSGKPRFVAGSIGPTAKGASLYPDINNPGKRSITWDELEAAYYDNARGLLDGGADIFLVETVFDTLNAKAALFAIGRLLEERQADVPVIVSAAITDGGRLLSGQTLDAFCASIFEMGSSLFKSAIFAIGLNCSFNAPKLLPHLRALAETVPYFVSVYPNAGLPNKYGFYDETPEIMSANIEKYLKEGLVNIAGGCCGSTPAHIAAIAEKAANYEPRKLPGFTPEENPRRVFFCGLEPLEVKYNTISVRNMIKPADMDEFQTLLAEGEFEDAADVARDMLEDGNSILEIKSDDENTVSKFLDYALMNPYVAKAPFFINSSRVNVIEAGLKRLQGRALAGTLSLKDGESELMRKARLIRRYGAAAVFSPDGEASAERIYKLLLENEYPAENIVFDVTSLVTAEENKICSWIRDNCPGVFIAI
ncbi:MAG: homocysteine S-methyltransferase family protein [Treponema sp.]|jgi:5-methyltetrahydrofolate--homocysteine methyltransferase|nr:homocysteine S-methyltransferase family protein [Treponema sp.]